MRFKGKHIDPYESFYWDTTPEFFRGQLGGGDSRTVKTDDSLAVMEEYNKEGCIQVGNIYPDSENMANRSSGRVNSAEGCSPTSRDFKQPKMIIEEPKIAAMRGRNPDNPSERGKSNGNYQQRLEVNENGTSNTITSVQKDNLVIEPQVMTPKRTEFGKSVRKEYEKGELDISRHAMTELTPRKDGISNTLTSVTSISPSTRMS